MPMKSFYLIFFIKKIFRYLKLCHTLPEVLGISGPRAVLTSWPDLESGFARDLFALWCSDVRNSIVLTSRAGVGTLGRQLFDGQSTGLSSVTLELKQRVKLEGLELEEYRRKERERNGASAAAAAEKRAATAAESSDEDTEELMQRPTNNHHHQGHQVTQPGGKNR